MSISTPAFEALKAIQEVSDGQLKHARKSASEASEVFKLLLRTSEKRAAGAVLQDQQIKFQSKVIEGTRDIQF